MALNLIKLCVGVSEVAQLKDWVKECKQGLDTLDHTTRMFPRRRDEILPGGSLYWVIKGMILCRQPIADLVAVTDAEGIERCRIEFKPRIISVKPTPRRAFQGWRYLSAEDAPPDLTAGEAKAELPLALQKELAGLGLL